MSVSMTPASASNALADAALSFQCSEAAIQQRVRQIHHTVLARSRYIRAANYTVIHPEDLGLLFAAYDERFFNGLCRRTLEGRKLRFRLSPSMTKAGGATTRFVTAAGETFYEITVASSMLFEGFGTMDRRITVCGLECENRLEALQRIFEHEMVHLVEHLFRAALPGHGAPVLPASCAHTQADHAAGTGRAIGNTGGLARHVFVRGPRASGAGEPPHQTCHRPGGGPGGRKVLRWPPL